MKEAGILVDTESVRSSCERSRDAWLIQRVGQRNRRHPSVVPSPVEQKEEQVTQQQDESPVEVEDQQSV